MKAKEQPVLKTQRYILLPATGLQTLNETQETKHFFSRLRSATANVAIRGLATESSPAPELKVIDSIHENGAKLVELSPDDLATLRANQPGLRVLPEVFYYPQHIRFRVKSQLKLQARGVGTKIRVVDKVSGAPITGALVVLFTNFAQRQGIEGTTDQAGDLLFRLGPSPLDVDQLHIYPRLGYWSLLRKKFALHSGDTFNPQPLDLSQTDVVRHFYGNTAPGAGRGVTVGVIDSGVGPHPDLVVALGRNTITGEDPADYSDIDQHGTHVAGIIAGRGTPPAGLQGVAPDVVLHAYRVFAAGEEGASNFAIAKAIDQAVADGCDLINMSLGGGPPDDLIREAIENAYTQGTIAFVATGNDDRAPVSFPAAFPFSIAVSAMGRKGTFPRGTTDDNNVQPPLGTDPKNFVAAFSNVGPQVDVVGPGVAAVSTVPGGYAPMSGTSMACPAITGAAARLLAGEPAILGMARTQARAEAMIRHLAGQAEAMGFGSIYEGIGRYR